MPETSLDLTIACGKLRQRLADVEWRATVAETLYDQKCTEVAQLQTALDDATRDATPVVVDELGAHLKAEEPAPDGEA